MLLIMRLLVLYLLVVCKIDKLLKRYFSNLGFCLLCFVIFKYYFFFKWQLLVIFSGWCNLGFYWISGCSYWGMFVVYVSFFVYGVDLRFCGLKKNKYNV